MKATTSIHQDLIENIIQESKRLVKENAILREKLDKALEDQAQLLHQLAWLTRKVDEQR